MQNEIQRASFWKRIAAWMFDSIIVVTISVGIAFLLSGILNYNTYSNTLSQKYEKYENEFGVDFEVSKESYELFTEEEKQNWNNAYDALCSDNDAMYAYSMSVNLSLIIISAALFFGIILWDFLLPVILGNGQTLGKKIFSLCLVKPNSVKVNRIQLFVRALLGKFTVETMIPIYILLMLLWGTLNLFGLLILAILVVVQAVLLIVNENKALIHDLLAGTVVADSTSTRIFESENELIEYKKTCHANEVNKKTY